MGFFEKVVDFTKEKVQEMREAVDRYEIYDDELLKSMLRNHLNGSDRLSYIDYCAVTKILKDRGYNVK